MAQHKAVVLAKIGSVGPLHPDHLQVCTRPTHALSQQCTRSMPTKQMRTGSHVQTVSSCSEIELSSAGQAAVMPAAVAATAAVPSVATAAAEVGDSKQEEQGDEAAAESPMMRGVMFYALESQQESLVWQVQPTHVILYDPDIPFIRQLEVSIWEWGCFCGLAFAALWPVQGQHISQKSAAFHVL